MKKFGIYIFYAVILLCVIFKFAGAGAQSAKPARGGGEACLKYCDSNPNSAAIAPCKCFYECTPDFARTTATCAPFAEPLKLKDASPDGPPKPAKGTGSVCSKYCDGNPNPAAIAPCKCFYECTPDFARTTATCAPFAAALAKKDSEAPAQPAPVPNPWAGATTTPTPAAPASNQTYPEVAIAPAAGTPPPSLPPEVNDLMCMFKNKTTRPCLNVLMYEPYFQDPKTKTLVPFIAPDGNSYRSKNWLDVDVMLPWFAKCANAAYAKDENKTQRTNMAKYLAHQECLQKLREKIKKLNNQLVCNPADQPFVSRKQRTATIGTEILEKVITDKYKDLPTTPQACLMPPFQAKVEVLNCSLAGGQDMMNTCQDLIPIYKDIVSNTSDPNEVRAQMKKRGRFTSLFDASVFLQICRPQTNSIVNGQLTTMGTFTPSDTVLYNMYCGTTFRTKEGCRSSRFCSWYE